MNLKIILITVAGEWLGSLLSYALGSAEPPTYFRFVFVEIVELLPPKACEHNTQFITFKTDLTVKGHIESL